VREGEYDKEVKKNIVATFYTTMNIEFLSLLKSLYTLAEKCKG
jgi:hypothetical protein